MKVPGGRLARRLVVAALAVAAALAATEAFLRAFDAVDYRRPWKESGPSTRIHRRSSTPGLEYELAPESSCKLPDGTIATTNGHGMRGPEVSFEKPSGTVRIAAVGDSFTFGKGVADDETYPHYLQLALNGLDDGEARYEVLNFGVSGYSTRDEAAVLRSKVLRFHPDVVVLGYVLNDPEVHPSHSLHMYFHRPAWWERLCLTRFVAGAFHALELRWLGYEPDRHVFEYLHDPRAGHWRTVVDGFADIRAVAREAGLPVVLVVFPTLGGQSWKSYRYDAIHARVKDLGERDGFRVLDLKQELSRRTEAPRRLMLTTSGHANPHGNRVFAQIVAAYLLADVLPDLRD